MVIFNDNEAVDLLFYKFIINTYLMDHILYSMQVYHACLSKMTLE